MTKNRLTRVRRESSSQSLIDLRLLVLLGMAGLMVWLAIVHPAVAAAVGLGLSTIFVLHRLVGR